MSQYPENAPRRKLTPEQRQRILKMRRMRRLKKRLMIAVPALVLVIVVLVVGLTSTGKNKDASAMPPLALNVEDTQSATDTEAADAIPTEGETPEDATEGELLPEGDAEGGDGTTDVAEAPTQSAALPASSGSFEYGAAYIAATQVEITGAPITPD